MFLRRRLTSGRQPAPSLERDVCSTQRSA